MSTSQGQKKIQVAVVGGGIGGLCVALGLLKHPHLDVQIYEAAHKFSEIGAGVAFGPNAQRALKLIGPELEQAYLNQATHNQSKDMANTWFEYEFGMGPRVGEKIAAPKNETGQATVHRAKFLQEFVTLLPGGIAHFGKRMDEIKDNGKGGVKIIFKDGTSAHSDCLIGADGVHSVTRRFLLGDDDRATDATFSASVAYRALVPMQQAVDAIGERYAQNSFVWVGKGACIMIYPIDFGKTMNIVGINSSYDHWNGPWVQNASFSSLAEEFSNWSGTAQKVIQLLNRPETSAWSMWDHLPAHTYCRGNVVMMGDAAHATTPFQGQGAGQAIEDGFVLSALMGEVDSVDKIPYAFRAYDRIRRPRSQKVCQTSREAGELVAMRLPGVGEDAAAIKNNLEWRMDWIWHRDIAGERDEAMIIYKKLCDGGSID